MLPADWGVFVISLEDAGLRRAPLLRQLSQLGLPCEHLQAIDGRAGLKQKFEAQVDRAAARRRVGRPLTDSELACGLSHLSVWRKIVNTGLKGAIILEDDAILTPFFPAFLAAEGYLASDFVQMDHMDARVWWFRDRVLTPGIRLAALAENASLASGYCLSQRAARYLVAGSVPLAGLADWPCDLSALAPLATLPRVVDHPPIVVATSTLEKERLEMQAQADPRLPRLTRFTYASYWKRWWLKRRTRKIS